MKKRLIVTLILISTISLSITGCKSEESAEPKNTQSVVVQTDSEDSECETEIVTETETENVFTEPEGRITSGMGAINDGKLYYAIAGDGCHTGIIERDLSTGEETEVVSNENTNGFSYLSVYDGYIYCVWNKGNGSDSDNNQIYRFSLDDFSGEYLTDGDMPIVAEHKVYYWNTEWDNDGISATATLYQCDVNTTEISDVGTFGGTAYGIANGYRYDGIYDYYYLDGKIYVGISYEELGDYDESAGLYTFKENAQKGVTVFDLNGNELDQSTYGIEYLNYDSDSSSYGMDVIIGKSEVINGGKMLKGYSGESEILNYIDMNGEITTLKEWSPAE